MTNKMQRYTVFYFCKLLYMFWVDLPPIIRSLTLYLQHLVFVKLLLLPAAIMEELKPDAVDLLMMGWGSTRNM